MASEKVPEPVRLQGELPSDPLGFQQKPIESAFGYSAGNRQMMKEYGMTEQEFAYEFGGRPHQQRQSPVARSDLERLQIPLNRWDFCSHKYTPFHLCNKANGGHYGGIHGCSHTFHEYEICMAAEVIRQNQVIAKKKEAHAMYTNSEKNWLWNDPNWGHMLWRSRHGADTFKGRFMVGGGTRNFDPPMHELSMSDNPKYNPDAVRADPHPMWYMHKLGIGHGVGFKHFWNMSAMQSTGWYSAENRAPEATVPFDPIVDGAIKKPW